MRKCTGLASTLIKMPTANMWIDYDRESDVLYMSFRKPQHATRTIEAGEDILVRKDGKTLVGITVLNASCH